MEESGVPSPYSLTLPRPHNCSPRNGEYCSSTQDFWSTMGHQKCDNQAVVAVLTHSKTKDPFLATCARNMVWLLVA